MKSMDDDMQKVRDVFVDNELITKNTNYQLILTQDIF